LSKTYDLVIARVFRNTVANLEESLRQLAGANDGRPPCKRSEDGVDYSLGQNIRRDAPGPKRFGGLTKLCRRGWLSRRVMGQSFDFIRRTRSNRLHEAGGDHKIVKRRQKITPKRWRSPLPPPSQAASSAQVRGFRQLLASK
jgi:hypothetical protein